MKPLYTSISESIFDRANSLYDDPEKVARAVAEEEFGKNFLGAKYKDFIHIQYLDKISPNISLYLKCFPKLRTHTDIQIDDELVGGKNFWSTIETQSGLEGDYTHLENLDITYKKQRGIKSCILRCQGFPTFKNVKLHDTDRCSATFNIGISEGEPNFQGLSGKVDNIFINFIPDSEAHYQEFVQAMENQQLLKRWGFGEFKCNVINIHTPHANYQIYKPGHKYVVAQR